MPGRYEFRYQPRQRDGWFKLGNLDVTTTAAMVGLAIVSMLVYAADKVFLLKFALNSTLVRDGDLWRIITWPLVNPLQGDGGFGAILVVLGLVFVWFVGHEIEELIGRRRFTVMVALMTVIPAIVVSALDVLDDRYEYGLFALAMGMLAVIVFHEPNRPFFFGAPAWVIGLVYAFLIVIQEVADRSWGTLLLYVCVVATAAVFMRQLGYLGDTLGWIPSAGNKRAHPPRRGHTPKRSTQRKSSGRSSSRGPRVVEGPWSAPTPPASGDQLAAQAELDDLLDKISAGGLDSLSADEKRRLNELSKRLR